MLDRIFWLICLVLGIVSLVKGDTEDARDLFLLALICSNSADLKELETEVKRLKRGK